MYLVTKWFGTFLCDKNKIKKEILFPKNAEKIVKRLQEIGKNNILSEEKKLTKGITVTVNEKRLQQIGEYVDDDLFFKKICIEPEEYGFSQELSQKVSILLAQKKVDERLRSEDLQIIQMVNALDDMIQTANLLSERLSCWSVIPTPEEKIQPFRNTLSKVNEEIKRLEQQIDVDMKHIAPNISKIVGPLIGARLISLAGGMQKLAVMPTSTVQILGAEKALFRFKKEGGKPPKHGVLFQHLLINKSPKTERGKIARILAAKTATAAKADAFTKRDIADDLLEEMTVRIKEMRNK
jgi:nucleolar protein 56